MDEHKPWIEALDPRDLVQIKHAVVYAEQYSNAGAPGHSQFMLIAKLVRLLDEQEGKPPETRIQKITWSKEDNCWRDIYTGVKVML